jgi:hypothetical protein
MSPLQPESGAFFSRILYGVVEIEISQKGRIVGFEIKSCSMTFLR